MKIEIKNKEEKDFPKLMNHREDKNLIVLFTSKNSGTVLSSGKSSSSTWEVGKLVMGGWVAVEGFFEDFKGELTLSNE